MGRVDRAVLSLGSNQGDRAATLRAAIAALAETPGVRVVAASAGYDTAPVGGPPQDDYLNAVVLADTDLAAHELLRVAHDIEARHGRVRAVRWGPRTLDIDLVAVGDTRLDTGDLVLPHPRAAERAFVLVPWLEVDPQAALPGGARVGDLVQAVDVSGVRRRTDLLAPLPAPEEATR